MPRRKICSRLGRFLLWAVLFSPTALPVWGQVAAAKASRSEPSPLDEAAQKVREAYTDQDHGAAWAQLPIGLFDSGTGGLSVLEEILRLDLFDNQTSEPTPGGGTIGVLATKGTVAADAYPAAIRRLAEQLGFAGPIEVVQQGSLGLAGAIDGTREFFITVPCPRHPGVKLDQHGWFTYEYKYDRSEGRRDSDVRTVPLVPRYLDPQSAERLARDVPGVWRLMQEFRTTNEKLGGQQQNQ